MSLMKKNELPHRITKMLENLSAPHHLRQHLQIVYTTASELCFLLKQEWPAIEWDEELILFGAGTHDIGKAIIKNELFEKGKEHELVGEKILERFACSKRESRFARTHGNWQEDELQLEDLLVSLADKIWKGKRIEELEEKVGLALANNLNIPYWEIYEKLNHILEKLSMGADQRL